MHMSHVAPAPGANDSHAFHCSLSGFACLNWPALQFFLSKNHHYIPVKDFLGNMCTALKIHFFKS
jgi:hypothetical protein